MASHEDTDLFMSVKLDGGGRVCNVVVTSQTTGQDVIECLRPDDDKIYYLVELWKGCERPINNEEKLKSVLLQWGSDVNDVTFMLKKKLASSRQKHSQKKKTESPRSSPVDFHDHVHEQQLKVESMQRVLQEKEQYLKTLRENEVLKNGLKTNYVRHLELKVLEQEEQLKSMRSLEEELFKYQVDNKSLILELQRLRSLFALKHQQLSDATARVDMLTKQLDQGHHSGVLGNAVGVPGEEIPRDQNMNKHQRNVGQNDRQQDSLKRNFPGKHHLTEAQIMRQNANMLHNKAYLGTTKQSESTGNHHVFPQHVNSKENNELNRVSLRDDEENDTETSQDSGHVSIDHDSPSYHSGGMGPSFQFHGNPPGGNFEKVECFELDREFDNGHASLDVTKDLQVSSAVDGPSHASHDSIARARNRLVKNKVSHGGPNHRHVVGQPNHKQPLFVQTDDKQIGPAQHSRSQSKHDSPQSTSSGSSQASQLSLTNRDAEMRHDREGTKASPSKSIAKGSPGDAHSSASNTLTRKGNKTKVHVRGGSLDRTLGSISLYRSRGDSPTPKDYVSPQATDSKVEPARGAAVKLDEKNKIGLSRQPIQSSGVQDLLGDISGLPMSTRDTKPLQIQTRAEKDSENMTRTSPLAGHSRNPDQTVDSKAQNVPRMVPKPLPRKRTKTPPARGSLPGEGSNIVVTSARTINESSTSSPVRSGNDELRGNEKGAGFVAKEELTDARLSSGESGKKGRGGTKVVGESSLKKDTAGRGNKKSGKRVSLDPHAVLLHASLEGELELVKSIIHQVEDPSFPNTEGLTALHHSVCNSHDGIVKFLVEYGCDINAADMQGWTSLHCAAANNSVALSQFLVTHGACIFAVTAIEGKTPSLCCERDTEDFQECFSYLSELESNFGVINDGVVYAVYAYQASRKDELSFECGERLTVVRRGDVTEKEWWWARDSRNQFGYIPRNLLAVQPRIAPDV